jgi:hypothetical protein
LPASLSCVRHSSPPFAHTHNTATPTSDAHPHSPIRMPMHPCRLAILSCPLLSYTFGLFSSRAFYLPHPPILKHPHTHTQARARRHAHAHPLSLSHPPIYTCIHFILYSQADRCVCRPWLGYWWTDRFCVRAHGRKSGFLGHRRVLSPHVHGSWSRHGS